VHRRILAVKQAGFREQQYARAGGTQLRSHGMHLCEPSDECRISTLLPFSRLDHDRRKNITSAESICLIDRLASTDTPLAEEREAAVKLWSGRAGRFLQNHQRVGYTTESYVGVARGGATGVNDLTGCGRKPFGTAG
jgi:hypothetical protein